MYTAIVFAVIFLMWLAFSNPLKTNIGEGTVACHLKTLPRNKYIVFNDVMIKMGRGSTQIDHIVVSQYGIFVIETKNISGFINGTEFAENWTKTHHGRNYTFFNPITQNRGHINALAHKLGIPKTKFIPIIVFSMNSRLMLPQMSVPVVYTPQVAGRIKCYRDVKLSVPQANKIAAQIQKIKQYKSVSNREHILDVQRAINDKKKKIAARICPNCGGRLVLRHGAFGDFLGCSNYPRCKYTYHK